MFHCSVAEMLDRVSSSELTEWLAWCQLEEEDRIAAKQRRPGTR